MKKAILLSLLLAIVNIVFGQETVVFYENFESASRPSGWTEQKVIGLGGTGSLVSWQYTNGGYYDYPEFPAQGNRNAMFQLESDKGETTKLITPAIDLSDVAKPELRFAHVQQIWEDVGVEYWDRLKVYYKRGFDSSWVLLESYLNPVSDWTDRSILLPDSSLSSTYYIAFEGITGFGWGTCIDTMRIVETGTTAKYVDSYSINQSSTDFIPTNTKKNPIININFNVKGNSGNLYLDSLKVTSLNTNDDDIAINGVKLYTTTDSIFKDPILISGAEVNFENGVADFQNIGYDLPRGKSTIWITYDIVEATDHDIHNNIADAKITTESIFINGYGYPFVDKSPSGKRLIKEAIFQDSFESLEGWELNGSFEIAIPMGYNVSGDGNPDPSTAFSGSYVLGTDLTSDGNYSANLDPKEDSAVSPNFDCLYYKDVNLYFARWLNNQSFWDQASIDISTDNKNTWTEYWTGVGSDASWKSIIYDLDQADLKENVSIRFGLGPTNGSLDYTGWNIDDFIITGDFISKDVGITKITLPETSCGHTTEDDISVYIENYAGEISPGTIPLKYEIDGSGVYVTDTYATAPINLNDSAFFTFSVGADLSAPGPHTIKVQTILEGDEISSNNLMTKSIFSFPTITLPYSQDFETNYGYYQSAGKNTTWEYGTPSGSTIGDAASGTKAWVTNLNGPYPSNDSTCLLTPCFDFTGVDSVIFEFKSKGISEDQTDGLTILYSTDQGSTWDVVPDDHDYYWNWYNETSISTLGLPGFDDTNGEWTTYRQLLPPDFSDLSSVQFKFLFESNANNNLEGFGIDDIKIYEAPSDLGVSAILKPYNACEWSNSTQVEITVENYGITTLPAGSKIPVGLDFQGSYFTTDTVELVTPLAPEATVNFTFTETVDMSNAGDYDFTAYTLLETDPYFYNETVCNDSISETVTVQGMPNYNPFPEFIGVDAGSPISVLLDAGAGYDNYSWNPPSGSVQQITATAVGTYSVEVTKNASPDNCTATDTIEIIGSTTDITVNSIVTDLADSCELTERKQLTELTINITNNGLADLTNVDDTIFLAYQINDLTMVEDTLDNPGLAQAASTNFTFSTKCDLRAAGEYSIKVFHNFPQDLNTADDTAYALINTWKYPDVNLAYDTIYSSQADTLTLDAGSGFASYLWAPGDSATQTITPTNSSYYYKVTVTDSHGCGDDKDSTYIETHDLGISAVTSPADVCEDVASSSTPINIQVTNYSDSVYSSADLKLFYEYDGGAAQEINTSISVGASSFTTLNGVANIDVTAVGEHTLKIYTSSAIDANHTNDTLELTFNTWLLPTVDLAYDTILTTQADTVVLKVSDEFGTYAWNDDVGNDSSTFVVTKNYSQKYVVTVTDINGCGNDKDSTYVITYDLGIIDLIAPVSACSHSSTSKVTVKIKNFSDDIIKQDSIIPVGYKINGAAPVIEYITLQADLDPSATINYTFTNRVDLSNIATYNVDVFTSFENDVVTSNDTLVDVIKTFGYPSIEIGDDIYTTEPETVVITAPAGYNYYLWNDGTSTNTLSVTYPASRLYSVTVADINGCTATDSLNVYTYDIGVASINSPATTCTFGSSETVNVSILNNSQDTLLNGESVDLSYSLNGGTAVNNTYVLTSDLLPDSTFEYSFPGTIDLTSSTNHSIEVTCSRSIDVDNSNDNLTSDIEEVGYPSFNLGDDILSTDPEGTIIEGPTGYDTYEWQDGTITTDYTIAYPATRLYSLTVTDSYGCEGSDDIYVYTYDVAVNSLITPVSQCVLSNKETVKIKIINNSQDTLLKDDVINVSYILNSGTPVNETLTLTDSLKPGGTVNYTFSKKADLSNNQTHSFELSAEYPNHDAQTNDELTKEVDYQTPSPDLGPDVDTPDEQYTLDAGPGYESYMWFDGETITRTYVIDINEQSSDHLYSVAVTNAEGCTGSDTIKVTFSTKPDLRLLDMTSPVSACWQAGEKYPVTITISNDGVVTLSSGSSFTVGYSVDGGSEHTDIITLDQAMSKNDTREHTFTDSVTFSSAKLYKFNPFVQYDETLDDENPDNDTQEFSVDITQAEVDFVGQSDTVYFDEGQTFTIQLNGTYLEYQWSTNETSSTIDVTEEGAYTVTVTDVNQCEAEGTFYCFWNTTGIDNVIKGNGYSLTYYPNPATDKVLVQFNNSKSTDVTIEIISINGQVIYNKELKDIKDSLEQIDVNSYANGIYYLRFRINGNLYTRKVVIQ